MITAEDASAPLYAGIEVQAPDYFVSLKTGQRFFVKNTDPKRSTHLFERANPRAWQTALTGRPHPARASAQSTFFRSVRHGFLEDFVLQRLLAKHALKLGDLGTSGCQLRGRNTASSADTAVNAPCRSSLRHWSSRLAATPS
ncbi:hypothetical protein J2W33_005440 [Variovorax boronicumulans]|nr:hypothetical protein [Variovorax boronicumulans]